MALPAPIGTPASLSGTTGASGTYTYTGGGILFFVASLQETAAPTYNSIAAIKVGATFNTATRFASLYFLPASDLTGLTPTTGYTAAVTGGLTTTKMVVIEWQPNVQPLIVPLGETGTGVTTLSETVPNIPLASCVLQFVAATGGDIEGSTGQTEVIDDTSDAGFPVWAGYEGFTAFDASEACAVSLGSSVTGVMLSTIMVRSALPRLWQCTHAYDASKQTSALATQIDDVSGHAAHGTRIGTSISIVDNYFNFGEAAPGGATQGITSPQAAPTTGSYSAVTVVRRGGSANWAAGREQGILDCAGSSGCTPMRCGGDDQLHMIHDGYNEIAPTGDFITSWAVDAPHTLGITFSSTASRGRVYLDASLTLDQTSFNALNGAGNMQWFCWADGNWAHEALGCAFYNGVELTSGEVAAALSALGPLSVSSLSPVDGGTGVALTPTLTITFDKAPTIGAGSFRIVRTGVGTAETIAATSSQVTISGNVVTIAASATLIAGTGYHVEADATAIPGWAGIADTTAWNWTTDSGSSAYGIATETDAVVALVGADHVSIGVAADTGVAVALTGSEQSAIGVATETGAAVGLVGSDRATPGVATETGAAVHLTGSDLAAFGLATETDESIALEEAGVSSYGVATETDVAISLVGSVRAAYGVAAESGAPVALVGSDRAALGVAIETDSAVALAGHAAGAWGVATEAGAALALAAANHATYGLATETDEALALAGGDAYAYGVAAETGTAIPLTGSVLAAYGFATETDLAVALARVFAGDDSLTLVSATDRDQPVALVSSTARDQPIVLLSIGE